MVANTFGSIQVTSFQTSLPLSLQYHQAIGFGICYIVMLAIYYSDTWNAKSFPFMSTKLRSADGGTYPSAKLFVGGVLSQTALAQYGLPRLTGTFAYSLLMANAAVSNSRSLFPLAESDIYSRSAHSLPTSSSSWVQTLSQRTRALARASSTTATTITWSSTTRRPLGGGT